MSVGPQRRFGYQPIQDVIQRDGRTIRGFIRARIAGDQQSHALLAIAGRVPPSPELRTELAAALGLPIESLFTAEALDAVYQATHRPPLVMPV